MTATAPERTLDQRMAALNAANEIRCYRAQLKRDLKARTQKASSHIAQPASQIDSMRVHDLLLAAPKLGLVKVRSLLADLRISPIKTIGGLSDRQRDELVRALQWRGL